MSILNITVNCVVGPDSLNPDPDPAVQVNPDSDPGFCFDDNLGKDTAEHFFMSYFDLKLQFTYSYAFINDIQAIEEACSLQKGTSSTSKDEIY